MAEQRRFIVIDAADNVATAITDLQAGEMVETGRGQVRLLRDIPFGHKFALADIPERAYVVKYGAQIGRATAPIPQGDHVHVHNVDDIVDEVRRG
jgi:altronate dehydratase small subunit